MDDQLRSHRACRGRARRSRTRRRARRKAAPAGTNTKDALRARHREIRRGARSGGNWGRTRRRPSLLAEWRPCRKGLAWLAHRSTRAPDSPPPIALVAFPRMLPLEFHLELRSRLPARSNGKAGRRPPLLFVHGGYVDAWCWDMYCLPWFARQGYAANALSLRGHGESGGREALFVAGLDDYAADVERIASQLPATPVPVGHPMGA